jgi:hypothetical protein
LEKSEGFNEQKEENERSISTEELAKRTPEASILDKQETETPSNSTGLDSSVDDCMNDKE